MENVEIINSEHEVLIEAAAKLYAADIFDDFEYSKYINKIYDSIKDK